MRYECVFNAERDIQPTVPDMAVDLAGAIETGVVLDTGMIAEHNDIDSPASIIGRVHDAFDALEYQRSIVAKGKAMDAAASTAAESVPTPPAAE